MWHARIKKREKINKKKLKNYLKFFVLIARNKLSQRRSKDRRRLLICHREREIVIDSFFVKKGRKKGTYNSSVARKGIFWRMDTGRRKSDIVASQNTVTEMTAYRN